jgi:mannitol/fructose-specific phosphotransferase system IIA component (Ntr-type)
MRRGPPASGSHRADATPATSAEPPTRRDAVTLIELAGYLELPPPVVDQLAQRGAIPSLETPEGRRFDTREVDLWLDLAMPGWPDAELHMVATWGRTRRVSLTESLDRSNVLLNIEGREQRDCLDHLVSALDLPAGIDRAALAARLRAREELCSTVVNGFAISHTSRRGPRLASRNTVAVAHVAEPIRFPADDALVGIVLLILAADRAAHLQLLARAASLARLPGFGQTLRAARTPEEIHRILSRAEQCLFE